MLDWHFKSKTYKINKFDENVVRLYIVKCNNNSKSRKASNSVVCKFGKTAYSKVTNTEYVVFAIDLSRKRLYFKESNAVSGFKCYKSGRSGSYEFKCSINEMDEKNLTKHIGYYYLEFDEEENLYYIPFDKNLSH